MASALLEVAVLHPADAEAADAGGADRVELLARPEDGGFSPEPAAVRVVARATELPVRVRLRLGDGYSATGGELSRLIGLAESYLANGAEGVVFGFLTRDLEIDAQLTDAVADALRGSPWTFSPAIDATLDLRRAWRNLFGLPGLDAVHTAGSALGVAHGRDELVALAVRDDRIAARILAGGGLDAESVPWLVRAGIRQFHVAEQVRPGGSWTRTHVDASYVRSWRLLLDDAVERAVLAG
jgi:copper homeostasis protein